MQITHKVVCSGLSVRLESFSLPLLRVGVVATIAISFNDDFVASKTGMKGVQCFMSLLTSVANKVHMMIVS